jgi:hypothetical protein
VFRAVQVSGCSEFGLFVFRVVHGSGLSRSAILYNRVNYLVLA